MSHTPAEWMMGGIEKQQQLNDFYAQLSATTPVESSSMVSLEGMHDAVADLDLIMPSPPPPPSLLASSDEALHSIDSVERNEMVSVFIMKVNHALTSLCCSHRF